MNKKQTIITLDTLRVIEEHNQVTFYRLAKNVTEQPTPWVQTTPDGVSPNQVSEMATQLAYLQRQNKHHKQDLEEGSLRYSCDVNAQLILLGALITVALIIGGVLNYAENFSYLKAIGLGLSCSFACLLFGRFVAMPIIQRWDDWRLKVARDKRSRR